MANPTTLTLDDISLLLVWTAIAVYALGFLAYATDLSRRSASTVTPHRMPVLAGSRTGPSTGPSPEDHPHSTEAARDRLASDKASRYVWARIGTTLTTLGFVLHLGGTLARGVAADRVPWANMYEFALTGTLLIVAVYLAVLRRYDLRFLGAFLIGMVVLLLGGAALSFYVEVTPLMDPLKSVWLVIHVFVASLATALFAIACGLSVTQLLQSRRERHTAPTRRQIAQPEPPVASKKRSYLDTLPPADTLEALAYRFAIVGFVAWTFTLIAGAIWANDSWGRYWGFDTKEVWTFVIWVLYAGYIHARATKGWRGVRSAWLSIVGFAAVLFNFTVVNMFFKGLHSYSGLS